MHKGDRWLYILDYCENSQAYRAIGNNARFPVPTREIMREVDSFLSTRSSETDIHTARKVPDSISTSTLGVFDRDDFNFELYADIIKHFDIKPSERLNPGRVFDARLAEIVEEQKTK